MQVLKTIVHNANDHARAEIRIPDTNKVGIDAGSSARLAGVLQVPLIAEEGIVGRRTQGVFARRKRIS